MEPIDIQPTACNESEMGALIEHGVTVLFTTDTGDQIRAEALAAKMQLTCCASRWMGQHSAAHNFSHLNGKDHPNRILIVKAPELSHGVRFRADRVLWVGSTGARATELRKVFDQSMARARQGHIAGKMATPYVFAGVPLDD